MGRWDDRDAKREEHHTEEGFMDKVVKSWNWIPKDDGDILVRYMKLVSESIELQYQLHEGQLSIQEQIECMRTLEDNIKERKAIIDMLERMGKGAL